MSAKSELFERLKYLARATALNHVTDVGIGPSEHNGTANLLRKGLSIVAFNILEDYIKKRAHEALLEICRSTVRFSNLTEEFQLASTLEAITAIGARARLVKRLGGNWRDLIQDESLKIHSTKQVVFELSQYSFFASGSNIGDAEIKDMLKAFGISGGWTTLKQISDQIGGGLPDLAQAYRNAATRRHSAAHSVSFYYDHQWLRDISDEILAICATFDIALSAKIRQIYRNPSKRIDDHGHVQAALKFRFLETRPDVIAEKLTLTGRSRKNWPDVESAYNALTPQLKRRGEFLILSDSRKRIEDWHV